MVVAILENQDIMPMRSSQTTVGWPLMLRLDDEQIIGYGVGHDVGGPVVQPYDDADWDEIADRVFDEFAEAWERLAAL